MEGGEKEVRKETESEDIHGSFYRLLLKHYRLGVSAACHTLGFIVSNMQQCATLMCDKSFTQTKSPAPYYICIAKEKKRRKNK